MVAAISVDWQDVMGGDVGEAFARAAWRKAVADVAERAKAALPQCNGRVEAAVKLMLAGDVELLADGTAKVASQSNGTATYYQVNGECQCKDFPRAPHGGMCKHRIAYGIAKRAQALASKEVQALDVPASIEAAQEEAQPAAAPAATLPEAPASANAFVMLDGHRVQITVRGHTLAGVLTEIRTVLAQFPAEAAAKEPAAPEEPEDPYCPLHPGEFLRLHTKGDQQWRSHRLADGSWCRGGKK